MCLKSLTNNYSQSYDATQMSWFKSNRLKSAWGQSDRCKKVKHWLKEEEEKEEEKEKEKEEEMEKIFQL